MKRNIKADITKLFAVLFAAAVMVMNFNVMTVNAAGGYDGTSYNYELEDMNTLGATVTVKTNMLKVKKNNAAQIVRPAKVVVNGVALKLNKNYSVLYQVYNENRGWKTVDSLAAPGLYRMCVVGIGNYRGVTTKKIYVYDPKDGERCTPVSSWKVAVNKVSYTGEPITEGVIKSIKYKKATLVEGEDYTVRYLNNVNSGTGIVRITAIEGMGFVGERDVKFKITGGTKIDKAKVTGIAAKTYDYGNAVEQDMSQVKVMVGKNELVYGVDYDVAYYMNNTKVGTAKVIINGKGRYNGSITKTFKINKITLNSDMLDDASRSITAEYTKKAIKPEVTLYNSNGEQLVKNVDYTLAYKNNVKMSEKAVITVKGKGNYAGSFNVNFTITDKKAEEEKKPEKPETPVKPEKPETPDKPDVPETGEDTGEESKGDETTETGETTGDENKGDTETGETTGDDTENGDDTGDTGDNNNTGDENKGAVETDETTGEESKGDETVTPIQKPIGYRICDCQCIMPVYTYGMSDIEKKTWSDHLRKHNDDGWTPTYTTVSYDKALKYKIIKEDANGNWALSQGTLLMPYDKVEKPEVEEPTTDETPETGESTGEESKGDETTETGDKTGEGNGEETKGDDVVTPVQKPIAFRSCDCGVIMPVYTYGLSDIEKKTWSDHLYEHNMNGWQAHYSSASYEKALRAKTIAEDANGNWILLRGTLLLPSESKVEEPLVEEPATEESEEPTTKESEETQPEKSKELVPEEMKEPEVEETEVSEVDPNKLVGLRECWCGCELEIYARGLTKSEESFWKDHMNCHARNGESTDYTETHF